MGAGVGVSFLPDPEAAKGAAKVAMAVSTLGGGFRVSCTAMAWNNMHVMLLVPLYEGSPSRLSHEPSGRRHEYRCTVPVKSLAHSLGIQGPPCGLGGPWMPRMSCLGRLLPGSLRQEGIV